MSAPVQPDHLRRKVRLMDAVAIVAGSMIGSGIFIVGADIMRNTGSAGWYILVWIIAGLMTLMAALSYGELSALFPRAGGQYAYLKESYGSLVAFVYGWSLFSIIQTGTIAAVGVSFFKFLTYFYPAFSETFIWVQWGSFSISSAQLGAIALIVLLTFINTRGIETGKHVQTGFTLAKVLSIGGLIVFGFIHLDLDVWNQNWSNPWDLQRINPDGSTQSYPDLSALGGALAAALVGAIMSHEAWNNVTFIAGEVRNPKRNIGLSLLIGVLLVMLVYVLLNLMFTAVLPLHEIATQEKDRVGIGAAQAIFGSTGTAVIAVLIMVSTFGCNNGLIISGARVLYSMAQDGLFFKRARRLNRRATPSFALWMQCIMASILCLSGKYGDLLAMITFTAVLFYIITILGIYILRVKRPDAVRSYKAPGYPIVPALYVICGIAFCALLIAYKPQFTWSGLLIALAGIPIYYLTRLNRLKRRGRLK